MNKASNIIVVLLLVLSTMTVMAGAIIAPALPTINKFFSALYLENMEFETKLLITIPALSVAIFSPIIGFLSDKIGRKKILISAVLIYGIFGSAGLFIGDIYILMFSRFMLGVGMAGIMITVTALISDYFKAEARENFFGLQAFMNASSGLVFLTLGGLLVHFGWEYPFLIYTFAFLIFPFALIFIKDVPKHDEVNKKFVKSSFQIQQIYKVVFLAFSSSIAFYSIPVLLPFYLVHHFNSHGFEIGLAISFTTLASATSSLFFKSIRQKHSSEKIFLIASIFMGIGLSSLYIEFENYFFTLGSTATFGFGMGLAMPNFNSTLVSKVFEENRGKALGALSSSIFFGMFLSPIFIGFLNLTLAQSYLFLGIMVFGLGLLYFTSERAKFS